MLPAIREGGLPIIVFVGCPTLVSKASMLGRSSSSTHWMRIGEPVAAAEPADGLAFAGQEGQGWTARDCIPEGFELPVTGPGPQVGLKGLRIQEQVDSPRRSVG